MNLSQFLSLWKGLITTLWKQPVIHQLQTAMLKWSGHQVTLVRKAKMVLCTFDNLLYCSLLTIILCLRACKQFCLIHTDEKAGQPLDQKKKKHSSKKQLWHEQTCLQFNVGCIITMYLPFECMQPTNLSNVNMKDYSYVNMWHVGACCCTCDHNLGSNSTFCCMSCFVLNSIK